MNLNDQVRGGCRRKRIAIKGISGRMVFLYRSGVHQFGFFIMFRGEAERRSSLWATIEFDKVV